MCAVHPDGPASNTCSDFAPNISRQAHDNTVKDCSGIRSVSDWDNWIKVLIIGLLFSFCGYSLAVWRIISYPPIAPTNKSKLLINKKGNEPFVPNKFELLNPERK